MSLSLEHTTLLHLSLIPGVGPALLQRLMTGCNQRQQSLSSLYTMRSSDLTSFWGITELQATLVVDGLSDRGRLTQELELLQKHTISLTTMMDQETYPILLRDIHLPPPVLYYKGNFDLHEKCLAVIGSRQADAYGNFAIQAIVPTLIKNQWTIVSGGALGADAMAHRSALHARGKTIAIIGSGLLKPYPLSHKDLFDAIVASGGAVISPFPLLMEAMPGNFPARNRIISGMSRGCLVVQAALKSGAAITARFALEQGRDVFAIPGQLDNPLSAGCHALIQDGAKLTTSAHDILQEFHEVATKQTVNSISQSTIFTQESLLQETALFDESASPKKQRLVLQKKHDTTTLAKQSNSVQPGAIHAQDMTANVSSRHATLSQQQGDAPKIENSIGSQDPRAIIVHSCAQRISFDELLVRTGLPFDDLQATLFDLQLEGFIEQDFMGQWKSL